MVQWCTVYSSSDNERTKSFLNDVIIKDGRTCNDFIAKARFRASQERMDLFCKEDVLFITKNYGFRRDKLKIELERKKAITNLILDWGTIKIVIKN